MIRILKDRDGDLWFETSPKSDHFFLLGERKSDWEHLTSVEYWGPLTEMRLVET